MFYIPTLQNTQRRIFKMKESPLEKLTLKDSTLKELTTKQCTTCYKIRKVSNFSMTSRKYMGVLYKYRRGECKFCQRKKKRQYTKDHREEQRKYFNKHYHENAAYYKKYYKNKKEKQNNE